MSLMAVRMKGFFLFVVFFFNLYMPVQCWGMVHKNRKYKPAPPPPTIPSYSPPACTAVGSDVSANMQLLNLCPSSCRVVVNHTVLDAAACPKWLASAFWDGVHCMSRCEAIGGVPVNGTACAVRGGEEVVVPFNRSGPVVPLSLVPVRCGTWLGPLDSARADSWFNAPCFSILSNRSSSRLIQCGAGVRTTGCRVMDTSQRWVEECRRTDAAECGVTVPCPASNNPCGLGSNFTANMLGDKNNCSAASSRLVVNAALNSTVACDDWTGNAFRHSDGYCVSACDNTADECMLDGSQVQPCMEESYARGLCYVSMPVSSETGVRNAFYGLTVNDEFDCRIRVLPRCNSSAEGCFRYEGLWVGFSFPASDLPVCNGNLSMDCHISWPCSDSALDGLISDCGFLRISDAMYRELRGGAMEAITCRWIWWRDMITCVLWGMAGLVGCGIFSNGLMTFAICVCILAWLVIMLVWEAGVVIVFCVLCFLLLRCIDNVGGEYRSP